MILAYHAQLNSVDEEVRLRAAKAWSTWEYVSPFSSICNIPGLILSRMWTSKLYVDQDYIARAAEDSWAK